MDFNGGGGGKNRVRIMNWSSSRGGLAATPEEKGHSSCDLMIRLSLCPHRVVHLDFVRKCSPILTISCISCHDALEPPCTHTRPRPSGLKGKIKEGRKGGRVGKRKCAGRGGRQQPAMDSAFSTRSMWGAACSGLLLLSQLCPCPLWSKIIKAQGRTALKNCFSCTTGCTTKVVISDTKVYFQFAGQNCSL